MAFLPDKILEEKLLTFLREDMEYGDITTEIIPDKNVKGIITAKQDGVICGIEFALILLRSMGLEAKKFKNDGDQVAVNDVLITIKGSGKSILVVERTLLNILMRLSGIATQTKNLIKQVNDSKTNITIASTRKTTPGFRYFEKYAVKIGGGDPHRWSLSDTILIKENHLAMFKGEKIRDILHNFKKKISFSKKIDIEIENLEAIEEIVNLEPDIIMLDNFQPNQVESALKILKAKKINKMPLIELSGGINENNIKDYLILGVDIISLGALTHSANSLDCSLKIQS
ncbi:MAG: carboxylating nicotinate-nucleotide diphosphorylase [Candidatus Hodarchaeales archaeon]